MADLHQLVVGEVAFLDQHCLEEDFGCHAHTEDCLHIWTRLKKLGVGAYKLRMRCPKKLECSGLKSRSSPDVHLPIAIVHAIDPVNHVRPDVSMVGPENRLDLNGHCLEAVKCVHTDLTENPWNVNRPERGIVEMDAGVNRTDLMRSMWTVLVEPIENPFGQRIVHGQSAVVLTSEVTHGFEGAPLVGDSFGTIPLINGTEPREKFGGAEHMVVRGLT